MKKLSALGAFLVGGVIVFQCLPRKLRSRLNAAAGQRMIKHMEHMMASLPADAPPRLVMKILPKLEAQNDQIIAMLREQNELLREHRRAA